MKLKFYSLLLAVIFILVSSIAFGLERVVETSKNTSGKIFSKITGSKEVENELNPNIILAHESKDHENLNKESEKKNKKNTKKSKIKKKKTAKKTKKKKDSKHANPM